MAKRKHKKKLQPLRLGDGPTMERRQQLGGTEQEIVDRDYHGNILVLRYRAAYECMLDAYLLKGLIGKAAHEAGMRYRLAWLRVVERVKVEDRFASGVSMGTEEWLNAVTQSEKYLNEASAALTEPQKAIIMRVCVDDKRAGGTDALETLRRGLENLEKIGNCGDKKSALSPQRGKLLPKTH
jgi:hypothetical protein